MHTIIGIGNHEEQYYKTRHNIGFMFLDFMAKKCGTGFEMDNKLHAETAKAVVKNGKIQLVKPHTYVNKTGDIIKKVKAAPKNILVIHDDLDIPFGKIKLSFDKDSAGHRGVESVMRALKTKKFYRLRIGLANSALKRARDQRTIEKKTEQVAKFVLSKFTPSEQKELPRIFKRALEILETHLK